MVEFNRQDFNADFLSQKDSLINDCIDISSSDSDDKLFCYLIANTYETLEDGKFFYTDGPNDLGIDFYVTEGNDYHIYQCKSCSLDGKVFDSTPVNELAEAIDYLLGEKRKASAQVKTLRNSYQLNSEDHILSATLAIQGRLSESAQDRLESLRRQYRDNGIEINLVDEISLFNYWHSFESDFKPSKIELKLTTDKSALMKQGTWFCAVLDAEPLLQGIEKYGSALFDSNVRANLKRSPINRAIKQTLSTIKGQKNFVHLNNGLVITCNSFKYANNGEDKNLVTLSGAQVINGCQTLNAIWQYYQDADKAAKEDLCRNLKVFAKVIQPSRQSDDELLDKIIITSNNQNPMNARNLKSNTSEQKKIQKSLYSSPLNKSIRYFYIRKDGEFDSFIENERTTREPKKRDFLIPDTQRRGVNKYRHIENETLAKIWWSWIGNSSSVNQGAVKVFDDKAYRNIFKRRPSSSYWEEEAETDFSFCEKLLEERMPTQYQLLSALAVSSYFQARIKPEEGLTAFKRHCIDQHIKNGDLNKQSSQQQRDEILSNDQEYLNVIWLNQMSYVLTEVAAFALLQKYGSLDSAVCKRLLDLPDVTLWLEKGLDPTALRLPEIQNGPLLSHLYSWVEFGAKQFLTIQQQSILIANRPKMYLGRHDSIVELKKQCYRVNEKARGLLLDGLDYGNNFLEMLPDFA